ncbi:MAG: CPBP family glutamic-type intramembrane protease [Anaerolineales bacterium]|nr:CPBP family glutamic-type intramembrane protease [Anaerolineales bacterium]
MKAKSLAPILPYLAVWLGLFLFKNAWATLLGFHLAILLALFALRPSLPLSVFFQPANGKLLLSTLLLCAASGFGLYLLRDFFHIANDLGAQLAEIGLNQDTWFGFIAYFALVNPFFEEYFWRGVLGSATRGFYFGDLVYAGFHVMIVWNKTRPFSILFMLAVLTFIGWLWRQHYRKDGSLLAPVLGHMAADLSILIALYKLATA